MSVIFDFPLKTIKGSKGGDCVLVYNCCSRSLHRKGDKLFILINSLPNIQTLQATTGGQTGGQRGIQPWARALRGP